MARRSDLEHLEARIDAAMGSFRSEIRSEIRGEINRLIMWLVPMNIGLAFAAARLA